eukprot:6807215-Prymnesium_polylepis.1
MACEGPGCGRRLRAKQMYNMLIEGKQVVLCACCIRKRSGLDNAVPRSGRGDLGLCHGRAEYDRPFVTREELDQDYEDDAVGARLRDSVIASGYGFSSEYGVDPITGSTVAPLTDMMCRIFCDLLVSGLGHRCLMIDFCNAQLSDAGFAALGLALSSAAAPCQNLMFLNLNGNPAGDAG